MRKLTAFVAALGITLVPLACTPVEKDTTVIKETPEVQKDTTVIKEKPDVIINNPPPK